MNISSSIDLIEFPPYNNDHQHHFLIFLQQKKSTKTVSLPAMFFTQWVPHPHQSQNMDPAVGMPCTVYCIRVSSLYVLLMKYICACRLICMHSVLKKCYLMYVLSMKCICAIHFSNPLYSVKTLLASHILTQHNTI